MVKDLRYSFLEEGEWWLPNKSNQKIIGFLSYEPSQGLSLDLKGGRLSTKNVEIIQGFLYREGKCSLLNCYLRSSTSTPNRVTNSRYDISYAFLGHYFNRIEDFTFLSATVHYTNLVKWVGRKRYVLSRRKKNDQYSVINLKELKYNLSEGNTSLKISPLRKFCSNSHKIDEKHNECITIRPKSKKLLSWYTDKSSQLTFLFAILMQKKIYPIKTIFEIRRKNSQGKIAKIHINCIQQMRGGNESFLENNNFEFLFNYDSIETVFQNILNNWFNSYEKLKPSVELYIDNFLYERNSIELEFLSYTQALESFHRTFYKNNYLSKEKYKKHYSSLSEAIPKELSSDHKDSLMSRIKYGYEYSLRTRLKYLFKSLDVRSSELITNNQSLFINNLIDTRNYLTHLDKNLSKSAMNSIQLIPFNHKLKLFILILILKKLGLSDKLITDKIRAHPYLSAVLRILDFAK